MSVQKCDYLCVLGYRKYKKGRLLKDSLIHINRQDLCELEMRLSIICQHHDTGSGEYRCYQLKTQGHQSQGAILCVS